MDRDWDNLIILDACRYDLFRSTNNISGKLSSIISRGSNTMEFLQGNFSNETFLDTVYITANPHLENTNVQLHYKYDLWKNDWDDELRTVLPETAAERAIQAGKQFPNKRIIVHLVQPHYPFIGSRGRRFNHASLTGDGAIADDTEYTTVWKQLRSGNLDPSLVWKAYRENLEIALPKVKKIVDRLAGKTVITSDHGNAFGERAHPIPIRIWGHPAGMYMDELVRVPWLVCSSSERRHIKSESPVEGPGRF